MSDNGSTAQYIRTHELVRYFISKILVLLFELVLALGPTNELV